MGSDTEHYMPCALEKITMVEAICSIYITVSEVVTCGTYGLWSLKTIKKCAQKKEPIDTWCRSSINTVADKLVSSEIISR